VKYAICFDFPEAPGEPVFAGWVEEKSGARSLGWAPTLKTAAFWDEKEVAQRHLDNGYGDSMRECGTVVEVPA
jgi:hypothetical protein